MIPWHNTSIMVAVVVTAVVTALPLYAQQPAQPLPEPPATDPATMKVAKGFKVELLYSVPKDQMGSWVCMCVDPKGRLIVSDQYGPLYRISVPPVGTTGEVKVERIPAPIGSAQGLLWAFDALYVMVNSSGKGKNSASGLYRVTSSKKDDTLDTVELLRAFEGGGGEHGPHALLLHPDGKRITVVCGNQTKLTKFDTTLVPPVWGEDHLLPRLPDGNGFMKGVLGPGGAIYNVTPDGKTWELFSVGFRNQYDAAYNRQGDLFTYDADMEWDFNTPWYRPTRVCFVTPGSEFGWRNGAGKRPEYYIDNVPPVLNVGPGSPTGVCFGYGAKFPAKYQEAFYICDWSYGKLYAVHLTPYGSTYKGELEEFVTGTPLPLTDIVINPQDGAMYFTIGGRRTKSGLYRVTYVGNESTAPAKPELKNPLPAEKEAYDSIRALGQKDSEPDYAKILELLPIAGRMGEMEARRILELHPNGSWRQMIFNQTHPTTAAHGLLAYIRVNTHCPDHKPNAPKPSAQFVGEILEALAKFDFAKLTDQQKLDIIRVYHVLFNRCGAPTKEQRAAWLEKFRPHFPDRNRFVNGELLQVFVYLQDETITPKAMQLLREAATQEEQLEYVRALRMLKVGWTPELRKEYFTWFVKAANYKGGSSFQGFVRLIKADAVATLSEEEKAALKDIINANPMTVKLPDEPTRPFVKAYKMEDLVPLLEKGLQSGRDFDRGRKIFAAAKCFACHRYDNEGGSNGPDLTGVAGRFSPRDLLESIIDPSKEISDQYAAVEIRTVDERVITGRIVNLNTDDIMVNTDMLNPGGTVRVNRKQIESIRPSKISMMPAGLLDTFKEDEILDLLAYMLSRGDRNHVMFKN